MQFTEDLGLMTKAPYRLNCFEVNAVNYAHDLSGAPYSNANDVGSTAELFAGFESLKPATAWTVVENW